MNKEYKRVEVKIKDIDEILLIVNYQTYDLPDLNVSYMHLTYLGEIVWHEAPDYERLNKELPDIDYKKYFSVVEENMEDIYQNPDKIMVIDGIEIETIGIPHNYCYNRGLMV